MLLVSMWWFASEGGTKFSPITQTSLGDSTLGVVSRMAVAIWTGNGGRKSRALCHISSSLHAALRCAKNFIIHVEGITGTIHQPRLRRSKLQPNTRHLVVDYIK